MNLKILFIYCINFFCFASYAQVQTVCQTVSQSNLGLDRNQFSFDNQTQNETYQHDFIIPTGMVDCGTPVITAATITLEINSITNNTDGVICDEFGIFANVYVNCSDYCHPNQSVNGGCNNFATFINTPGTYTLDWSNCWGNPVPNIGDNIQFDVIPAMDFSNSGCSSNASAISDGLYTVDYSFCFEFTYGSSASPPAAPMLTSPEPICVGDNMPELSASDGFGISIDWYHSDPSLGTPPVQHTGTTYTPTTSTANSGTIDFWAVARNFSGCLSDPSMASVVINSLANAGMDGSADICNDNNTTLNLENALTGTPDAGGFWVDDDGSGVNLADPTNVSFSGIAPGDYDFVYMVSNSCSSASAVVAVTVLQATDGDCGGVSTPFITTWKTDNTGTSCSTCITIPTIGEGYHYEVDWDNDGVFDESGLTGNVTHDYGLEGTYTVAIRGDFPRIYFNNSGDKEKIMMIEQWGDISWSSMERAFYGAKNLTYHANDVPDLSNVTNMSRMFSNASSFYGDLSIWDVSNVTNMSWMFTSASSFNSDLSGWNVTNVTNMSRMFSHASSFYSDLSAWDVSNVTDMSFMFSYASFFNSDLNIWDVSNVVNMSWMFSGTSDFTSNLSTWDVSNVTNMSFMFSRASSFTSDLSSWNVDNVTNISYMFFGASSFNSDLSGWNVANVTNTHATFYGANSFNSDLSSWNVANVTIMHSMFFEASSFNSDLSTWDVSNVTNMSWMFTSASSFNSDLSNWNVTNVNYMIYMFSGASSFNQNLGNWNLNPLVFTTSMLDNSGLSVSNYDNTLIGWENQDITGKELGAIGLKYCNGTVARNALITEHGWTIDGDVLGCAAPFTFITTWKTDNPGISNATSITIPTIGTGYNYEVDWDGDGVFDEFNIIGSITHDFGVSGIYSIVIRGDFPRIYFNNEGDKEKILAIEQWGDISWGSMERAFSGTVNLTYHATDTPDLSNVTNMDLMFYQASSFNGDLSNWEVSSVTSMNQVFSGASSFNSDLSTWNTSNVTSMEEMFNSAASFNSDLSTWNVTKVINMNSMFSGASSFNKSLGNWNLNPLVTLVGMLDHSGLYYTNYDNTLIGWESQNLSNKTLDAHGLKYCNGEVARNTLMNTKGWIISGDILNCPTPFISSWKTDFPGSSNATSIIIPTTGEGYNYEVDWDNDGVFDEFGITGNIIHDFGAAGTYAIAIRGDFPRIYFNNAGDRQKIIAIEQWGDINWSIMERAFTGATNLINNANDAPDLSNVTSMNNMFSDASSFNGNLSNWDVSTITDMSWMFSNASSFNSDLSTWDVSNVTDMHAMFASATSFNSDLSNWDVTNVTDMSNLFFEASSFNSNLNNWNVSNVVDIHSIFSNATSFNSDLSNWDVSKVTTMGSMFDGAISFNGNISTWDVSNVTGMFYMFSNASSFNGNLSNWNIANVKDMDNMFSNASSFSGNLSTWDVSNVTNMWGMFANATSFNSDLSNWDVSKVRYMDDMFSSASSFNQSLGSWNLNASVYMFGMLDNCGLSTTSYDNTLIGWESQGITNKFLGAEGVKYCNSETERDELVYNQGWFILGDQLDCTALPLRFISLEATFDVENIVHLNWTTASAINLSHFEIEHSTDGENWAYLGQVEGKENTLELQHYNYLHHNPKLGENYYRLQQVDHTGKSEYSEIVSIVVSQTDVAWEIYPNPTTGILNINVPENAEEIVVQVLSGSGKLLSTNILLNSQNLNLSHLPKGIYYLKVISDESSFMKRIILQ